VTGTSDLAARIHAACHLTGDFVLRSGRTAHECFDKYQLEADPPLLDEVAERMAAGVPPARRPDRDRGGAPVRVVIAEDL
jgi:orotate phosphoribosyltransferase